MARKRKRDPEYRSPPVPSKKAKTRRGSFNDEAPTQHPVLRLYYPKVLTLRQYLLSQLPASSKSRRKKITFLRPLSTTTNQIDAEPRILHSTALSKDETAEDREILVKLLDTTLIGVPSQKRAPDEQIIHNDFVAFSQKLNSSANSSLGNANFSLSEVRDHLGHAIEFRLKVASMVNALTGYRFCYINFVQQDIWDRKVSQAPAVSWVPKSYCST